LAVRQCSQREFRNSLRPDNSKWQIISVDAIVVPALGNQLNGGGGRRVIARYQLYARQRQLSCCYFHRSAADKTAVQNPDEFTRRFFFTSVLVAKHVAFVLYSSPSPWLSPPGSVVAVTGKCWH